jgi:hypothetical protein
MRASIKISLVTSLVASSFTLNAFADNGNHGNACSGLPTYTQLKAALVSAASTDSSGFNLNMWATVVNRDGVVCAVAFTGNDRGDQWPGSRVISAQKANTANAFSLPGLALSTANLWSAVQGTSSVSPLGGSLYGLQFSNPVNPQVAYGGNSNLIGTKNDPMVGRKIGGVNVFGGGLALYNSAGTIVGSSTIWRQFMCRSYASLVNP